jgi:hypothetical protein
VPAKRKLKHGTWGAVVRATKPSKWSPERLLKLLSVVEAARQKNGFSTDREAIRSIMGEPKWRPRRPTADLEKWLETLESRLQDAKRIKREERDGGPTLDPYSAAILYELQKAAGQNSGN